MSHTIKGPCTFKPFAFGILLLVNLSGTPAAEAHDRKSAFHMTVISDAIFGSHVRNGAYDEAISGIAASNINERDRFFAATNFCVAYTKTGELGSASAACEEAVRLVPVDRASARGARSAINRRYRALALSNRGVVRAIAGDESLARTDFESALRLRGGLSAPSRNLAYLENRSASAALQTGR